MKFFLMFLMLLFSINYSHANQDYDINDVIGVFANLGTVGPYAGTHTVTEAHMKCMSEQGSGETSARTIESDHYNSYKDCMALYVPFKVAGEGEIGSCAPTEVSWGECGSLVPSLSEGEFFSAKNTLNPELYEGFAAFMCVSGEVKYQNGGCSKAVQPCEEGLIADWPVTSPLWADESSKTVYVDKFGQTRHTPKGRCFARMPESLSGNAIKVVPTSPETLEIENYFTGSSVASKRCFDEEWMDDSTLTANKCDYKPKSCKAMTYNHPDGCGFELPSADHDTIFVSNKPTPFNSIGTTQAYCWDGEWEVKSSSCEVSCVASIESYQWSGSDTRACQHPADNASTRIKPGTSTLLENTVAGMNGSVSYMCEKGKNVIKSEYCEPKNCEDSIPGRSWGSNGASCSHGAKPGYLMTHNQAPSTFKSEGGLLAEYLGSVSYSCQYGELVAFDEICVDSGNTQCISQSVIEQPDPLSGGNFDVEFEECEILGMTYESGLCCTNNTRLREKRCYQMP